jgi:hypothetical protein
MDWREYRFCGYRNFHNQNEREYKQSIRTSNLEFLSLSHALNSEFISSTRTAKTNHRELSKLTRAKSQCLNTTNIASTILLSTLLSQQLLLPSGSNLSRVASSWPESWSSHYWPSSCSGRWVTVALGSGYLSSLQCLALDPSKPSMVSQFHVRCQALLIIWKVLTSLWKEEPAVSPFASADISN